MHSELLFTPTQALMVLTIKDGNELAKLALSTYSLHQRSINLIEMFAAV
jgi:hypothetical protein